MFQSTHPHGVRRVLREHILDELDVSIHAPTRGATRLLCCKITNTRFQSTHPHGVRRNSTNALRVLDLVSIHAPTRGATTCILMTVLRICCFNPRTHTGCDLTGIFKTDAQLRFQSTHPHGVRHVYINDNSLWIDVSIHAPTRGAT